MRKTFTAQSVANNHGWDFETNTSGTITKLIIKSEVNYDGMRQREGLDIWGTLNANQKNKIQEAYDQAAQWFNKQFLG
ncbi:hypothetical protein LCGC14_1487720 [marine sediment metagenome]|uniref:Uncharacterized protein n=1 Tax=marine sediment metagenome TaxID=412755 RepID=A0A0F9J7R0_9ZZZZ